MEKIELWGGVECSHNRVGDEYFDQISRSGHLARLSDLDLFAGLGLKKLRYPVLWEHIAPESLASPNWAWADERLNRLRELNIEPIVGFVHHGSGPRYTSMVSDNFAQGLADFAGQVAARYPWINYYTPVNEPLTTARFSGLYGFWYPHGKSDKIFVRALYNQILGTKLAMEAIRKVNPAAKLVQTEDLGKTHSTPLLAYQTRFENKRRWLSFDLLCGKVTPKHAFWKYLIDSGLSKEELLALTQNPVTPDILGINHYVTSERFLDEHLIAYPMHTHGSNRKHRYADVETVRVKGIKRAGIKTLLQEAWTRYNLPIAITEAHICCTREEQMRWFKEIWDGAVAVKKSGAQIEAVTAWALLGSYDWNSLLTQERNIYENGVYDMRSPEPRPTGMVNMLRNLAISGKYDHAVLSVKGWWDREERYTYKNEIEYINEPEHKSHQQEMLTPVLITGATGTLGNAFARICQARGVAYKLLNRSELDIANPESVENAINIYKPWAIINTAGYVRVDDAEQEAERCYRENTDGPAILAEKCRQHTIQLLTFSSDLVFDGNKETAYTEDDEPLPKNIYGTSKMRAEQQVLDILPSALVVRTSAFFGIWDKHNFVYHALKAYVTGQPFTAANDVYISPTYVPDLVHTALDLLLDRAAGIWHLTNQGAYTWADLAWRVAAIAKLDNVHINAVPVAELNLPAYRPKNTVLTSVKANLMGSVEDALYKCVQEIMLHMEHEAAEMEKEANHRLTNIFTAGNTGTD